MHIDDLELPDCLERLNDGSIRITGHRVSLFNIIDAVYNGRSISEMHSEFPTVPDSKLSEARDFCIRNSDTARRYYAEQCQAAEKLRLSTRNDGPTREELLGRMNARRGAEQAELTHARTPAADS
jgi:uncharacterized protein (DUF433 family)